MDLKNLNIALRSIRLVKLKNSKKISSFYFLLSSFCTAKNIYNSSSSIFYLVRGFEYFYLVQQKVPRFKNWSDFLRRFPCVT